MSDVNNGQHFISIEVDVHYEWNECDQKCKQVTSIH